MNGFENLSKTTTSVENDDDGLLKDMDLSTSQSSDNGQFTFKWNVRQGIYKVILYAENAVATIADWQVFKQSVCVCLCVCVCVCV